MADATQVTMADMAFTDVPICKFHGTAMPVAEEDEPSTQKDVENPAVKALLVEADFHRVAGNDFPSLQVDSQSHILNPSHALDFFTLPIDVHRRLIREY